MMFVSYVCFVACLTSQATNRVYFRERSAQTIVRAGALRKKLQKEVQTKLAISLSHRRVMPGQAVLALIVCQASGREAIRIHIFEVTV